MAWRARQAPAAIIAVAGGGARCFIPARRESPHFIRLGNDFFSFSGHGSGLNVKNIWRECAVKMTISKLKVLIVDPNEHMRQMVAQILYSFGCKWTREARDGKEAIQILHSYRADLVITEWVMTPIDGADFLRHLRTADESPAKYVPVIVLSGNSFAASVAEARDSGTTEFLAKPIAATTLRDRIVSILNQPREFIEAEAYIGPDRRRRRNEYSGDDRRNTNEAAGEAESGRKAAG